jgi:hypothetical protein
MGALVSIVIITCRGLKGNLISTHVCSINPFVVQYGHGRRAWRYLCCCLGILKNMPTRTFKSMCFILKQVLHVFFLL